MILVTGGGGYVGRPLCQRLVESGLGVLSASRKSYDTEGYESLIADVTDKASLESIFDSYPIQTVVHLAAMLNTQSRLNPGGAVRVNVLGSLHLLELCRDKGVSRFVFGSSYNALGSRPGATEPFDESEPALPTEFYGETKRFVEHLGIAMAELDGFEFISARMSIVVGPGEPSSTSAWRTDMFNLLNSGGRVRIDFAEDEVIPLIHYQDLADAMAMLILAEKPQYSIYNLPSDSWRVGDLAAELEEIGNGLIVECGDRRLDGIPPFVSWDRLRSELQVEPVPLRRRLLEQREVAV